jgi:hypothetical protein
VQAAVLYTMGKAGDAGNTVIGWGELWAACCDLLGAHFGPAVAEACSAMFGSGMLVPFEASECIATAVDYRHEAIIWEYVK